MNLIGWPVDSLPDAEREPDTVVGCCPRPLLLLVVTALVRKELALRAQLPLAGR